MSPGRRSQFYSHFEALLERHLPKAKSSRSAHRRKHRGKELIFPMFCGKSQTPFGVHRLALSFSPRNPHRAHPERRGGAHRLAIAHFRFRLSLRFRFRFSFGDRSGEGKKRRRRIIRRSVEMKRRLGVERWRVSGLKTLDLHQDGDL